VLTAADNHKGLKVLYNVLLIATKKGLFVLDLPSLVDGPEPETSAILGATVSLQCSINNPGEYNVRYKPQKYLLAIGLSADLIPILTVNLNNLKTIYRVRCS